MRELSPKALEALFPGWPTRSCVVNHGVLVVRLAIPETLIESAMSGSHETRRLAEGLRGRVLPPLPETRTPLRRRKPRRCSARLR